MNVFELPIFEAYYQFEIIFLNDKIELCHKNLDLNSQAKIYTQKFSVIVLYNLVSDERFQQKYIDLRKTVAKTRLLAPWTLIKLICISNHSEFYLKQNDFSLIERIQQNAKLCKINLINQTSQVTHVHEQKKQLLHLIEFEISALY